MSTKKLTFAIITVGTRGDVQPLVTEVKELLRRGHEIVLFTNEVFRGFVSDELRAFAAGWTFVGLQGDHGAMLREPRVQEMVKKQDFPSIQMAMIALTEKVYAANADIILKWYAPGSRLPDVVIGTLQTWSLACVLAEGSSRARL